MKIWYESEDGVFFDDEGKCYEHEQKQKHTHLNSIVFFDKEENKYTIGEDIFNDDIYQKAEKVIIHNEEEYNDFAWIADECGWAEFYLIKEPGEWIRREELWDGRWERKE